MSTEILERIKYFREQKGYSQEYIAHNLCIGQSSYAKIEKNLLRLDLERLVKISKLLNVDLYFLLTGEICHSYTLQHSDIYVQGLLEKIKILESEIEFLRKLIDKSQ